MNLKYRADIDGLRAIAVLAVVFNHAGIKLFRGGYIGVDVFFVISGYLITGIIVRELEVNEFHLAKFYERRIRRIYPALFVTLFFTAIASAMLYNTANFSSFGRSMVATTFFVSNIHFWTETGYFDDPAQLKPLLHTWSLAVEEQYYIVFPLLMFLLWRYFKRWVPHILVVLALASLGWDVFILNINPSSAFYFAHLRAWELLIGGLLALNFIPEMANPLVNHALALAGFGMIIVPVLRYTSTTSFPGLAAAIPVFGTALIIFSSTRQWTFINRLLGTRVLVFVGRISYSLYLWHWPLIIFTKYYAIRRLTPGELCGLLLLIFTVSILSWKFIETPIREKRLFRGRDIFVYAASVMAIAAISGTIILQKKDVPRSPASAQEGSRAWSLACNFNEIKNVSAKKVKGCPMGTKEQAPTFLVWGDSHGRVAAEGISLAASKQGLSGELVYSTGCPPLLDMARGPGQLTCKRATDTIIKYIENHPQLKTVILVGRWALWAEGSSYSFVDEEMQFSIVDLLSKNKIMEPSPVLFERGLERTIEKLLELDRSVVIMRQVPEIGFNVRSANFIASRTGRDTNALIGLPVNFYYQRNRAVYTALDALSKKYNIRIVDPAQVLCNDTLCLTVVNKRPLYIDDHHLSVFGSNYISQIYDPLFQDLAK